MISKILLKYFDTDSTELLSKSLSFLVIRVFGTLISFIFSYYVSKKFGADIFGLISLGFTFFLVISVIGRLGLDINIVKHFSININDDTGLYMSSLLKSFVFTALLAFIAYSQGDFLVNSVFEVPKPELLPYLNWILLAVPFWSINLLNANFLRSKKKSSWYAFFNTSSRFLFALLILLVFSFYSSNPLIIVQAHFFGLILISLLSSILVVLNFNGFQYKAKINTWKFVKDSLPIMYSSSIIVILNWLGTFILGIYSTNEVVGIFSICIKIAFLLNFVSQALNSILAPKIANIFAGGNLSECQKLVSFSVKINFLFSFFIGVIIVIFNKPILGIFGEEFKTGSIIFIILCLGQLISAFSGSVGVILQMTGRQVIYQYLMIIALFISLFFMFLLVPIYGGEGAAIASLISMLSWNVLGAAYIQKKLSLKSYFTF